MTILRTKSFDSNNFSQSHNTTPLIRLAKKLPNHKTAHKRQTNVVFDIHEEMEYIIEVH